MTQKEIKKQYALEKRAAKIEYQQKLDLAEEGYQNALEEYFATVGKKKPVNPPKRPLLEEIGNAISHGIGSVFSIVTFILMLIASDSAVKYASSVIYFLGLFILFTSSCLYHAFAHGSAVKRLFRRFDYCSIYLLIGGTFAPVLLCVFNNSFGIIFFAFQWLIIACGISIVGVFGPTRLQFVHIIMYVILGWSALLLFSGMNAASPQLTSWILAGGVIYTIGIIPFLLKNKVAHFIWHLFVLGGAVVHWIGIYLYIFKA